MATGQQVLLIPPLMMGILRFLVVLPVNLSLLKLLQAHLREQHVSEYSLHWVLQPGPVTDVGVAKPNSGR